MLGTVILYWLVTGLLAGMIARLLTPGRARLGCFGTSFLGILGSIVGGTVGNLLAGFRFEVEPSGFIGSVLGAMLLLILARVFGWGQPPARFEDDLDVRRRR